MKSELLPIQINPECTPYDADSVVILSSHKGYRRNPANRRPANALRPKPPPRSPSRILPTKGKAPPITPRPPKPKPRLPKPPTNAGLTQLPPRPALKPKPELNPPP